MIQLRNVGLAGRCGKNLKNHELTWNWTFSDRYIHEGCGKKHHKKGIKPSSPLIWALLHRWKSQDPPQLGEKKSPARVPGARSYQVSWVIQSVSKRKGSKVPCLKGEEDTIYMLQYTMVTHQNHPLSVSQYFCLQISKIRRPVHCEKSDFGWFHGSTPRKTNV